MDALDKLPATPRQSDSSTLRTTQAAGSSTGSPIHGDLLDHITNSPHPVIQFAPPSPHQIPVAFKPDDDDDPHPSRTAFSQRPNSLPLSSVFSQLETLDFIDLAIKMAKIVHALNEQSTFLHITSDVHWSILFSPTQLTPHLNTQASLNKHHADNLNESNLLSTHYQHVAPEIIKPNLYPFSNQPATDVYTLSSLFYQLLINKSSSQLFLDPTSNHQSTSLPSAHSETPVDPNLASESPDPHNPRLLLAHLYETMNILPIRPSRFRSEIPRELDSILLKGLSKDPIDRYMNSFSLARDLEKLYHLLSITSSPTSPTAQLSQQLSRPHVCISHLRASSTPVVQRPVLRSISGSDTTVLIRTPQLIEVGALDRLARLEISNKLYGVEKISQELSSIIRQAHNNSDSALVVISGSSGVGKTQLAMQVAKPIVSQTGGLWLSIKFELQSDQTFSIRRKLLNSLLRPLVLSLNTNSDESHRSSSSQASSNSAGNFKRLVLDPLGDVSVKLLTPYIDRDLRAAFQLEQQADGPPDNASNPLLCKALDSAIVRIVRMCGSTFSSLMFLFDDLQWVHAPDCALLEHLLGALAEISSCIVLFCMRPYDSLDPCQHDFGNSELRRMVAECANVFELGPMKPENLIQWLADILGPLDSSDPRIMTIERRKELMTVADFIRHSSATTAMFCKQLIRTLRERAILVFDWDAELWRFDATAASEFMSNQPDKQLDSSVTSSSSHSHISSKPDNRRLHAEAVSFLRSVLEVLPARLKRILVHASCLSAQGPFTIQLLKTALGEQDASEHKQAVLRSDVTLLVNKKILKLESQSQPDHIRLSGEACSPAQYDREAVCFVHDQWNEASHQLLFDRQLRAQMYHSIAINLGATLEAIDEDAEGLRTRCLRTICYNLKLALEHGLFFAKDDWDMLYRTVIKTSKQELRDLNPRAVINYVEFCLTRLPPSDWNSRPSEMMQLHELLNEAYYLTGDLTNSLKIAREMRMRSRNALHFIKAMRAKLVSLFIVNPRKGVKLSIKTIEHYFKLKIGSKYKAMCEDGVFRQPFERRTCTKTPSAVEQEYQALLADMITAVYSTSVEQGEAIMWISYEFSQVVGRSVHVAYSVGALAILCSQENNLDAAKEYVALGESICGTELATPYQRLGFDFSSGASCHFLSPTWDNAGREHMERAERSTILANFEIATSSLAHALITGFWSSAKLHSQIDIAVSILSQSGKTSPAGSVFAAVALAAIENLTQASQSINDPTVLAHQYLMPDAYSTSEGFPLHDLQWTSFQLILNLLFEKPTWKLFCSKRDLAPHRSVLMQHVTCQFLFSVAICEGIRNGKEVNSEDRRFLDSTIERCAVWSSKTKMAEFEVMLLILQALVHSDSSKSSLGLVVDSFDDAIELASENSLWLFAGLACEMLCTYLDSSATKSSNRRLSFGYQIAAYEAYLTWGATRKCDQMRTKWPHLSDSLLQGFHTSKSPFTTELDDQKLQPGFRSQGSFTRPLSSSSPDLNCPIAPSKISPDIPLADERRTASSLQRQPSFGNKIESDASHSEDKELEPAALLGASPSWQIETTVEDMPISLMKVLLHISGAAYGCIALAVDDSLRVRAAGTTHKLQSNLDLSLHDARKLAPTSILRYVARTRETATSSLLEMRSLQDEFLSVRAPVRMFGQPIMLSGKLAGVVYLDSHSRTAFSDTDQNIIGCLSTQAVFALEKRLVSRLLEDKVNERARELSKRNEELAVALKVTDDARKSEARFLLNMSHELRTPANSIIVLSELLQEAPGLNRVYQEYLNQMKSSSNDLLEIIRHALDFSSLSSQAMLTEKLPFDLRDCVESAIQSVAGQATLKGLEVWCTTPIDQDPETLIIGDELRCKQVIMNYLSNAIRFTSWGGYVSVQARVRQVECQEEREDLIVEIDVKDNGIGIPKDKQENLFKSFSQVDESTTRLFGGTGLGLAISRSLAKLLGGDASVDSSPGSGSTFSFTFKAKAGDRISRFTNILTEALGQLPSSQTDCIVLAAPHISRHILCTNLRLSGVKSARVVNEMSGLKDEIRNGFKGVLIVDMLLRGPEALKYVWWLLKQKLMTRIVMIGNEMSTLKGDRQKKYLVKIMDHDDRLILSTRPIKMARLIEEFKSMLTEAQQDGVKHKLDQGRLEQKVVQKPVINRLPVLIVEFPLQILAVDDNQVNRLVIKRVLERLGYMDSDLAVDGKEAVEKCKTKMYDLCLMDSEMPNQDGTSAMKEIRCEYGEQAPFIAVLTAAAMPGQREKFLQSGFDAYLSKPVDLKELIEVIKDAGRRHMSKKRQVKE